MGKLTALLPLPLLLLLAAAAAGTARSQRTTTFNYDFNYVPPTTLTYQGTAQFLPNNRYLTLTGRNYNTAGRVLHTAPVPFKTGGRPLESFYSTIKFFIHATRPGEIESEGIAFFVAPAGSEIPPSSGGGHLGVYRVGGYSGGHLVIEFDTNPNAGWDPNYSHIGINLGTRISSNVTNMYGQLMGQEVTADISYLTATKRITVRVTIGRAVYEVSTVYDLSVFLYDEVQFGLSASTSYGIIASQDIISWHNNYTVAATDPTTLSSDH